MKLKVEKQIQKIKKHFYNINEEGAIFKSYIDGSNIFINS